MGWLQQTEKFQVQYTYDKNSASHLCLNPGCNRRCDHSCVVLCGVSILSNKSGGAVLSSASHYVKTQWTLWTWSRYRWYTHDHIRSCDVHDSQKVSLDGSSWTSETLAGVSHISLHPRSYTRAFSHIIQIWWDRFSQFLEYGGCRFKWRDWKIYLHPDTTNYSGTRIESE